MYEKIISKEEFFQYDRETQRHMFIKWRELYSNAEIMKKTGIQGNNAFQKLIKELDIPLKQTRKVQFTLKDRRKRRSQKCNRRR